MEKMNHEDRVALTRAIVGLLDGWGVSAADQVELLALPEGIRPGAIRQFRQGKPFPDDARVMERIEHLIGIADALRTSYPHRQPHAPCQHVRRRAARHYCRAYPSRLCL